MRSHKNAAIFHWLILIALIALPGRSFGWDDTRREIIASIAYRELTPAARTAAADLLRQHPRYETCSRECRQGLTQLYSFMIAATWPDLVRGK